LVTTTADRFRFGLTNRETLAAAVVRSEVLGATPKQNISSAAVQQFWCIPIEQRTFCSYPKRKLVMSAAGSAKPRRRKVANTLMSRPDRI
jgi:hypothetical protein